MRKRQAIEEILLKFKGLHTIQSIRNDGKKMRLTSIRGVNGQEQHGRQEIVDVFAQFYEDLYKKRELAEQRCEDRPTRRSSSPLNNITPISKEEVCKQASKTKNDKASDAAGVVAEMIKFAGETLFVMIADLFNDILLHGALPPDEWKRTRMKVLFKKGDTKAPCNYRPIALLQILYKLFSRVLHERLKPFLLPEQSIDQAGFRSSFSCEDHLLTMVLLYEKMAEHNLSLWIAVVDFEKAFDSVEHEAIWEAMLAQHAPSEYVAVLQKIYEGQTGQIIADRCSRVFGMGRGTRQGDPISPMLFNAVLEHMMRHLKHKWERKRYGVKVGFDMLQNLRFADDVMLIGATRAQILHMLEDLTLEASKVGLKLHMGRTKIMSNVSPRRGVLT